MYQFAWATEYPDTWSNIILGGSVGVFLREVSTLMGWSQQIALPKDMVVLHSLVKTRIEG